MNTATGTWLCRRKHSLIFAYPNYSLCEYTMFLFWAFNRLNENSILFYYHSFITNRTSVSIYSKPYTKFAYDINYAVLNEQAWIEIPLVLHTMEYKQLQDLVRVVHIWVFAPHLVAGCLQLNSYFLVLAVKEYTRVVQSCPYRIL